MLQWNHHLVLVHSPLKLTGYIMCGEDMVRERMQPPLEYTYKVQSEQWTVQPTTGPPPPGQYGGGCTTVMNHLYCFGGYYGLSSNLNDFYKMNCQSFEWSKIHPRNEGSLWPSKKAYCGLCPL